MRTIPIAAAALLAFASGMASAQTTPPRTPGIAPSATTAPVQRAIPNPLKQEDIAQIEGNNVYGGDDGKVGHVSTVLMNPETKQIDRLVVSAGGVLGIGGHRVAIPVDQFTWDTEKGAFRLPMTIANLKSTPEWVDGTETATGSSTPPRKETAPADAGSSGPPRP